MRSPLLHPRVAADRYGRSDPLADAIDDARRERAQWKLAEGANLDRLVAHFGIDRIPGETDAGLRRRVAVDRRFVRPTDAVQPYPLDEVTISWTHR